MLKRLPGLVDLPVTHPLAQLYLEASERPAAAPQHTPAQAERRRRARAARKVGQRQAAQARRKRQHRNARA